MSSYCPYCQQFHDTVSDMCAAYCMDLIASFDPLIDPSTGNQRDGGQMSSPGGVPAGQTESSSAPRQLSDNSLYKQTGTDIAWRPQSSNQAACDASESIAAVSPMAGELPRAVLSPRKPSRRSNQEVPGHSLLSRTGKGDELHIDCSCDHPGFNGKSAQNSFNRHLREEALKQEGKYFHCQHEYCDHQDVRESNLHQHLLLVHDSINCSYCFICYLCGKSFKTQESFDEHVDISCPVCGKWFASQDDLEKHMIKRHPDA